MDALAGNEGGHAYMNASEALAFLGVQHQTLYAYVSRGLIRSFRQPGRRTTFISAKMSSG